MVTILLTLRETSSQMQTFDDMEHTSKSQNACIYYEISDRPKEYKNLSNDGRITFKKLSVEYKDVLQPFAGNL